MTYVKRTKCAKPDPELVDERQGVSIFYKARNRDVLHTCWTYARGTANPYAHR